MDGDGEGRRACAFKLKPITPIPISHTPHSKDFVTVRVCRPTGCVELQSRYVVIATGSRACRPNTLRNGVVIPYTSRKVRRHHCCCSCNCS